MIKKLLFSYFLILNYFTCAMQQEQQLAIPNVTPEKIKKWKEKALPFLSQSIQRLEAPSQRLLDLCPEPVPEFYEELTVERLLATDVAKKLQQHSREELNNLINDIYMQQGGDAIYKWQRYAYAIAVAAGAHPDAGIRYSSMLHNASRYQDVEMVHFLLRQKANPNLLNYNGITVLFYAYNKYLAKLLHAYGAQLCKDLLHRAMWDTHTSDLVAWFLKKGLDPNAKERDISTTPLHSLTVFIYKHTTDSATAKCKALLDAGAKLDIKKNKDQTFLASVEQEKQQERNQQYHAKFDAIIACTLSHPNHPNNCHLPLR